MSLAKELANLVNRTVFGKRLVPPNSLGSPGSINSNSNSSKFLVKKPEAKEHEYSPETKLFVSAHKHAQNAHLAHKLGQNPANHAAQALEQNAKHYQLTKGVHALSSSDRKHMQFFTTITEKK